MNARINFPVSDLIAGYVVSYNAEDGIFVLSTSDRREFKVKLSPMAYAR
ncbi:hypothetical protein [Synechocystis salina]|nr:hypothetical protein [Synechocystis salina]